MLWNKSAGTITVVGDSGEGTREQGLAFNTADVLYLVKSGSELTMSELYIAITDFTSQSSIKSSGRIICRS